MGIYFEAGVGKATAGTSLEMGRSAAMEAISQLEKFKPALALVFVCSELDIGAVNQGVVQIIGDCPVIGTSTAGEIANGLVNTSIQKILSTKCCVCLRRERLESLRCF